MVDWKKRYGADDVWDRYCMDRKISSFVMSGGVRSRLWPFSRAENPKQFHKLTSEYSMLRDTVRRFEPIEKFRNDFSKTYVIASADHAALVRQECLAETMEPDCLFFEPVGRNTAAAAALAAQLIIERIGDGLVLLVPSDHKIEPVAAFQESIVKAIEPAVDGHLVVFGVRPTRPETGYGYIHAGSPLPTGGQQVESFTEKPNSEVAERYLAEGNYFWNSGMLMFKASVMEKEFLRLRPEIWHAVAQANSNRSDNSDGVFYRRDDYQEIPAEAVDTAILEKTDHIAMVSADFHWSDIGSWQSIYGLGTPDIDNNVISGDVVALNCRNTFIHNDGRLITAFGLDGLAVVNTNDASFISPLDQTQGVKDVFEILSKEERPEVLRNRSDYTLPLEGRNVSRVQDWLVGEAFPKWADIGADRAQGGFHEVVDFDGNSILADKRTRTMARQTWCFARAEKHSWIPDAGEIVEYGLQYLSGLLNQSQTLPKTMSHDGRIVDQTTDTYDVAFVLLAASAALEAGYEPARQLGRQVISILNDQLFDAEKQAWFETSAGVSDVRRSNPHMHLLEAFLAWNQATGDAAIFDPATQIVDLFETYFFDNESWLLGEYFDREFSRCSDNRGDIIQPGHHFEWCWLLHDYTSVTGTRPLNAAAKLYATALAHGPNRKTGLCWLNVDRRGAPLSGEFRSWPQAEAIKAAISMHQAGRQDLSEEIEERVDRLFKWHLDNAPKGLWIDRLDEYGTTTTQTVPSSIFYHIVSAFEAYLTYREAL